MKILSENSRSPARKVDASLMTMDPSTCRTSRLATVGFQWNQTSLLLWWVLGKWCAPSFPRPRTISHIHGCDVAGH